MADIRWTDERATSEGVEERGFTVAREGERVTGVCWQPEGDDGPWPLFPADLLSIMIVIATQAEGTTMIFGGKTMVFDTPIGKFRIISKEENPVWVPPDWHFAEEANKRGMGVVHLERGSTIDASTGTLTSRSRGRGFWSSWFGSSSGRVLRVRAEQPEALHGSPACGTSTVVVRSTASCAACRACSSCP